MISSRVESGSGSPGVPTQRQQARDQRQYGTKSKLGNVRSWRRKVRSGLPRAWV